jgi:hypothetical protein
VDFVNIGTRRLAQLCQFGKVSVPAKTLAMLVVLGIIQLYLEELRCKSALAKKQSAWEILASS